MKRLTVDKDTFEDKKIGKDVFLTKSEAEAALQKNERNGEGNMREKLYKAKRTDTSEWIYGLPSYNCVDGCITEIETRDCGFISVNPETICQYTGIPDKNGTKIFEGDICRREILGGTIIIGQVVWFDIGMCGFKLKHGNSYYPIGKDEYTGRSNDEVISNIFDNPELLESEVSE